MQCGEVGLPRVLCQIQPSGRLARLKRNEYSWGQITKDREAMKLGMGRMSLLSSATGHQAQVLFLF